VYEDVTVAADGEFETMFREVYPRLVSLGVLKTGRLEVARDLAQETMSRAHDRWNELSTYDVPGSWCRVVMANLLVDHHRAAASERNAVDRLARQGETGVGRAPDGGSTLSMERWNDLVRPLDHRQRLIVTLYYADDLSVGQIANLLDTSRGSVKAILFKARRTLRSRLEARAHTEADTDG
jgi:RNA polymerase sigma factor (sigma-70 family)